jgi:hypothetical protein
MSVSDYLSLSDCTCPRQAEISSHGPSSLGKFKPARSDSFDLDLFYGDSESFQPNSSQLNSRCERHPISGHVPAHVPDDGSSDLRTGTFDSGASQRLLDSEERFPYDPAIRIPLFGHEESQRQIKQLGLGLSDMHMNPDQQTCGSTPDTIDPSTIQREMSAISANSTEIVAAALPHIGGEKPVTLRGDTIHYSPPSVARSVSQGIEWGSSKAPSTEPLPMSSAAHSPAGMELADTEYLLSMDR